jgi:hypothetical protein
MLLFILRFVFYKLPGKRFLLPAIIFLIFSQSNFANVKTWTGMGADGNWSTPSNWSENSLPSAGDDVLLDNAVVSENYRVILPATLVTVKTVTISPSAGKIIQLILPATNILTPGFIATGPGYGLVINNGGVFKDSSGASNMAPVDIADSIMINNGGAFIHSTPRSHAANVAVLSKAPGTENGIFEFDVPGTQGYTVSISKRTYGSLIFSAKAALGTKTYTGTGSNALTINGDLQINAGVNLKADLAGLNGNIIVNGNYIQNGGIFNLASRPDSSILSIRGNLTQLAGAQIIASSTGRPAIELSGSAIQNVFLQGTLANNIIFRMNNAKGAVLLAPLSLPYQLNLVKGNIVTSPSTLLTLQNGCNISVDSSTANTSFIDGPLRKEGLSAASYFLFPVGKGSVMRWLELKNATGSFTIEFMKDNPRMIGNNYDAELDHISSNDYWTIDADDSPAPSANTELSFANGLSSGITDMSTLRIAQLSAGVWTNRGNIAATGTAMTSGSVVSEPVHIFGPSAKYFALGSTINDQNPLPVNLVSFSGAKINKQVLLNWEIDSPGDAAYFNIMASSDTQDFRFVGRVDAMESQTKYQFPDNPSYEGINYYRLQVVEKNGSAYFSRIVIIMNDALVFGLHFTSYSLVRSNIGINITAPVKARLQLLMISADGKLIRNIDIIAEKGNNPEILDLSGLRAGIYYLLARNPQVRTNVLRFIKQ